MEELLNKLIEKGWKPFNVDCAWNNIEVKNNIRDDWYIPEHSKIIFKTETHWHVFDCNIRDLVSKWSWLWQFVCENGMVEIKDNRYDYFEYYKWGDEEWAFREAQWRDESYEYRVIESALCDEDKLEEFLLNNIKIDEKYNI